MMLMLPSLLLLLWSKKSTRAASTFTRSEHDEDNENASLLVARTQFRRLEEKEEDESVSIEMDIFHDKKRLASIKEG